MAGYTYRGKPLPTAADPVPDRAETARAHAQALDRVRAEADEIRAGAVAEAEKIVAGARTEAKDIIGKATRSAEDIIHRAETIGSATAGVPVRHKYHAARQIVAVRGDERRLYGSAREASHALGYRGAFVSSRMHRSGGKPFEFEGWTYGFREDMPGLDSAQ